MPTFLGISAHYHDSAAALVDEHGIVAACAEERLSRIKHDSAFPLRAIAACLAQGERRLSEVDGVVFYEQPLATFDRILSTWLGEAPRGYGFFAASARGWTGERLFQGQRMRRALRRLDRNFDPDRLSFVAHHHSHAASAFYPSPFAQAAVLTLDGVGEWATTALAVGRGSTLTPLAELHHPHSLGLLYATFTAWCGFRVNNGEYKLMGLAPYGSPRFAEALLERVVQFGEDGSFKLNMHYFDFTREARMASPALHELLGVEVRRPDGPVTDDHRDLAASVQAVTEVVILHVARHLHRQTGLPNLCLAGGVALNGVAMGRLRREGPFERVWVQPAAGDDGGALGAALIGLYASGVPRTVDARAMRGGRLGPDVSPAAILEAVQASGLEGERLDAEALQARIVEDLCGGHAVGWFQGRSEFGPRALGGRSILADPRDPAAKDRLNQQIKHREGFRPFAPVVPVEVAQEWFELPEPSPHMSFVVPTRLPDGIPAVVHVDGSSRVQTVDRADAPALHGLLGAFAAKTGCPVLLNTSFNMRGEPIVQTPADALRCARAAGLHSVALGSVYVRIAAGLVDPGSGPARGVMRHG